MFTAAMLAIVKESAYAVMTLTEGTAQEELLRSRLTRREVKKHIEIIASTLANIPPEMRTLMPGISWDSWVGLPRQLGMTGEAEDSALCFGVDSLVPATLLWLMEYERTQPAMFAFKAD